MNNVTMIGIQVAMVLTGLGLVAFVYFRLPGMLAAWLATKERLAKLHGEERDRERQWQIQRDADDYKARHNDRNILMVGQSELIQQIMTGHERSLKIISESFCRYEKPCEKNGQTG